MEILLYTVSYKKYISLKAVAQICSISKVFLQILQNSLKNTCARVTFIIMLQAVASVPCHEYIKDKFLTHVRAFLFCFLCSVLIFPLKTLYCICLLVLISEEYSEPCQTSKMEFFTKTVNGLRPQKTPS